MYLKSERMQRLSTRLAFLATGMAMSVWAALVPFAKTRMNLESGRLGLLLLGLGIGSLIVMPLTGRWVARRGCRDVILAGGVATCLVLPVLALAASPLMLALALLLFGASVGALDVAMNVQAVIVERAHGTPLMSGFHGLFSVGGFVGAAGMSLLLWAGADPLLSCVVVTACIGVALGVAAPHLLEVRSARTTQPPFALPHGTVIAIGLVCFVLFLAEGAMLDWSGLLLTTEGGFTTDQGGLGYATFAVAMTVGRLSGDRTIRRWGKKRVLLASAVGTAAGFFTVVLAPSPSVSLAGFLLIGSGAANIVPLMFTAAGDQRDMPAGAAIGAVTTMGYAGIVIGPPIIGFVARASSLHWAFGALGCATLLVTASSRVVNAAAKPTAKPG